MRCLTLKNTDNWRTSLTSRTADALQHWLDARGDDEMYDGRDALWLTREGTKFRADLSPGYSVGYAMMQASRRAAGK